MANGEVAVEARADALDGAPVDAPVGRPWVRVAFGVGLLAALAFGVLVLDVRSFSLATLRGWIQAAGIWAPLAYVAFFVLAAVLVVPGTAIMVVGALLFPLPWAFGLVWSATVLASITCFLLARWLGRGFVGRLLGGRLARLDDSVAARGFQLVLLMRLAGLPPFNILNHVAGLTRIRLRDYVAGTALGVLPLVVAVVAVAGRLGRGPRLVDLATDPVLYAALALVGVVVWVAQRVKRGMVDLVEVPVDESE